MRVPLTKEKKMAISKLLSVKDWKLEHLGQEIGITQEAISMWFSKTPKATKSISGRVWERLEPLISPYMKKESQLPDNRELSEELKELDKAISELEEDSQRAFALIETKKLTEKILKVKNIR